MNWLTFILRRLTTWVEFISDIDNIAAQERPEDLEEKVKRLRDNYSINYWTYINEHKN